MFSKFNDLGSYPKRVVEPSDSITLTVRSRSYVLGSTEYTLSEEVRKLCHAAEMDAPSLLLVYESKGPTFMNLRPNREPHGVAFLGYYFESKGEHDEILHAYQSMGAVTIQDSISRIVGDSDIVYVQETTIDTYDKLGFDTRLSYFLESDCWHPDWDQEL